MAESVLRIKIDAQQALFNAQAVNKELKSIETTGNYATKSMDSLSVATRTLAGHMAGFVTVAGVVSKMDMFAGLQNRLKLVTNSQTELNRAMNDTFAIAQKTRQSWDSAAQVYQSFANNAKTLGLTMSQTAQLTETVSKAVAISGASAGAAEAALVQFGQALASGTLRGDELNSIMEQTPGLAKAIAEGLGITIGQLRTMGAAGQITGDALVKALDKAKGSVDDLFSKTDITIGQSVTLLNNELSKFVGEAGQSSGAATALAKSIQTLSQNLNLIADTGVALAVGYLTKSILTKADALKVDTVSAIASRQASIAKAQSEVAETTAALNAAKAHLANVQATNAEAQAKYGATAANARYVQAQAAVTAATNAQTVAQERLSLATLSFSKLASGAFALIGGPIGALTLGATALAAGYMYLKDQTAKATAKLEEQTKVASKTKDELLALQGVQKKGAIEDLQDSFKGQNEELKKLNNQFNSHVIALQNSYKFSADIVDISNQVRLGTISQEEAIKRLNKLDFIDPKQLQQLEKDNQLYREKAPIVQKVQEALKVYGINVKLAGNENSNAEAKIRGTSDALNEQGNAAERAKNKLDDLRKTYAQKNLDTDFALINIKSHGLEMGKALSDFYDDNKIPKTRSLTNEEWAVFQKHFDKQQALKKLEDDITDSRRAQTKETEKQLKVLQVNAQVRANAAKYNFGGLESRYGLLPGLLSGIHMQESRGNASVIGPMTKYGTAKGGFQFLDGTAKRFGLTGNDVFDLGKAAEAAAKYLQFLFRKFGSWDKAISAYHAGEGNVKAGTNIGPVNRQYVKNVKGYVAGANGYTGTSKDFDSSIADIIRFQEKSKDIELSYADAKTKRLNDHEKKLSDLKIHFSGDTYAKLERQENERYSNENRLAELLFDQQINGWKWVGEEKIRNEAEISKAQISVQTDMLDIDKQLNKEHIDELRDYKIAAYKRLQQDKLNEFKAALEQQTGELQRAYYEIMAQNKMTPQQRTLWEFQNQYSNSMSTAYDSYQNSVKDINKKDDKDQYVNDAETRNQMLLQAEQNYQNQLLLIKMKGVEDEKMLREQQYADNISVYGTMFGQMGDLVRGYTGESSGAYKTLIATQKAANLASAIMSGYTSIAAAWSSAPFPANLPNVAIATTKAGVLQAAIQAISPGFYTGGYTGPGGKFDPAGVVHKGEVVFSQEDIKRWGGVANVEAMRKGGMLGFSSGGYVDGNNSPITNTGYPKLPSFKESRVLDSLNSKNNESSVNAPITVYVTVQSDGSSEVKSEGVPKELGNMLGNAVRKVLIEECRQGRIIDREFRKRR
ncbi:tape measure protein [Acinetobacter stercoris]|uniref:Transglycosylase SLT domain protein n=1 Tax=Acinetobacter stercoris TaxID=2126983 RepID=A0A2U3MUS5_9GAMM|nr:tape measure protein [Acinetobacter stercoris]SPL69144.1 Transglycosylase SLT domain protein [Acinetobacter stercoris]